jgi:uncharacterized protein (DUF58 family)
MPHSEHDPVPLYAVIRRRSKYYGQTAPGERFPVSIQADETCGYVVAGGPGGQYRLADVELYAETPFGAFVRLNP